MITLDQVLSGRNVLRAIKQVVSNKGAPGIDGMTVDQYEAHHRRHWRSIAEHIRAGSYIPAPVRRVDIPKPNGGTRMLGIPTVQDRVIQQAIAQILVEAYDPHFSNSSYGFRPGRSALEAIEQASRYIKEGKNWVVEMDLEKFFDTVNHDRLMARLAKRIKDKALLKLIGRYLRNGIMQNGLVSPREEGTPQGSNLSPILSLIVLDELDKHLEGRGLSFCRYADDCNLFVSSRQAGERVLEKTIKFIEGTLKLRVNRSKSGLFRPSKSKFLGYTFVGTSGAPRVAKASFARLMYKLRPILRRGRGRSLLGTIKALTMILRGWRTYYALDDRKEVFERIDIHIRRHLRKLVWRAWKRPKTRERELRRRGLPSEQAWKSSVNGRGPWWNANAPHMRKAFPNSVFRRMGLYSLLSKA